jgi:hypothetical protein
MKHAKRPRKSALSAFIQPLDSKEREKLTAILNSPLMQRALGLAAQGRPSAFKKCPTMLDANNALYAIQGWELYEAALFRQTLDPKIVATLPEETYPETVEEEAVKE